MAELQSVPVPQLSAVLPLETCSLQSLESQSAAAVDPLFFVTLVARPSAPEILCEEQLVQELQPVPLVRGQSQWPLDRQVAPLVAPAIADRHKFAVSHLRTPLRWTFAVRSALGQQRGFVPQRVLP